MKIIDWIKDVKNLDLIKEENKELNNKIKTLGIDSFEESQKRVEQNENIIKEKIAEITKKDEEIQLKEKNIKSKKELIAELDSEIEKKNKQINSSINRINKNKEIYKSIDYSINNYLN